MNDQNSKPKGEPKEGSDAGESLEVELPEVREAAQEAEGGSRSSIVQDRKEAFKRDIQALETHRREFSEASKSDRESTRLSLPQLLWKLFLALGALSFAYFLSQAVLDPISFREGAGILVRLAFQLALSASVAGILYRVHQASAPQAQRNLERAIIALGLLLSLLALLFVFGLFDYRSRKVWGTGPFLLSLGAQIVGLVLLVKLRIWLRAQIDFADLLPRWIRPVMYLTEGVILYLLLGMLAQSVFHIQVPALVFGLFRNPPALFLFLVPFGGYFFLRKMVGEI